LTALPPGAEAHGSRRGKVAGVVKLGLGDQENDKRRDRMIWTLKIKLLSGRWVKMDWEATIALDASSTLADLHHIIQQAVGFDNDHLYGFYIARMPWSRDRVRYDGSQQCGWYDEDDDGNEVGDQEEDQDGDEYEDEGEDYAEEEDDAASTTILEGLFPLPTDRRLFYLFDYGDNWIFQISRARNKPFAPEPGTEWPRLISERGEKPPQYPEPDYTIQSP
jgi:hypothetical protein